MKFVPANTSWLGHHAKSWLLTSLPTLLSYRLDKTNR
jgi:hypothetical protein